MSSDDAFDRAVRALRETGETPAADVSSTRSRVLETIHRGERRGRRTFWVLLPIAAVLAASTAVAKNTEAVRRVWTSVAETIGIVTPLRSPAPPAVPKGGLEVVPPPQPAPQPASAAPEVETGAIESAARELDKGPPSGGAREGVPPAHRSRRTNVAVPAPPVPNPAPEVEPPEAPAGASPDDGEAAALQLYKNAYRLHFTEQRYAAALAGWDEYLRAVPAGRLVVEARYNRAIALARLGRRAEAEAALTPFARGEVSGGYRAREARELLDALRASTH